MLGGEVREEHDERAGQRRGHEREAGGVREPARDRRRDERDERDGADRGRADAGQRDGDEHER